MIAIVEDDDSIRELICYTLRNTGFDAVGFDHAQPFYAFLQTTTPQLILLDVMLPQEDGISILRKIRNNPQLGYIPVIMLTAKDAEYDKVVGLDNGADDYVTKPFGVMELISRIKAVLRRAEPSVTRTLLTCGDICLDKQAHTVQVAGIPVDLTVKEFSLLHMLMENKGRVMTRDLLLQSIWGYEYLGETRTVDVHVGTLRSKLGDSGDRIETIRGVGYKIGTTP